jgi:hypothetical protein
MYARPYESISGSGLASFSYVQMVIEVVGMGLAAFVFFVSDCQIAGAIIEGVYALYVVTIGFALFFNYQTYFSTSSYYTYNLMTMIFSVLAIASIASTGFFYYYFYVLSNPNVFNLLYKQYGGFVILFIFYTIASMISFMCYAYYAWTQISYYSSQSMSYYMVPQEQMQMIQMPQAQAPQIQIPQEVKPVEQPRPEMVKVPVYLFH